MTTTEQKITKELTYTDVIPHSPLRFALFIAKPYWPLGLAAFACVTIAELASVAIPFVLKKIIDVATHASQNPSANVFFWVLMFPTLMFSMFACYRLSGFIGMQWLTRTEAFGYNTLFEYLSQHSHTYFSNRFAGSVTNKLAHASEGVFRMLDGTLWGHYGAVLSLIASGALIFITNVWVGFIYSGLIVILIPINIALARHRRPFVVTYASHKTALRGRAVDVITNIAAVRQFSRREFERVQIGNSVEIMRSADVKQWKLSEWALVFNNVIITVALGAMLLIMYKLWMVQIVTAGDFVLVLTLIMSLSSTLVFIGNTMNQFIRIYGEVQEGLDEILLQHEITDTENAKPLLVHKGAIHFDNVTFMYDSKPVFDEFNLIIEPGQRVGLVGPSGAGKTTFVSLLLRQHNIDKGSITIDEQNIAKVTQDSLRASIAVVPQEPMLFHRSIRQNIAYGKDDATEDEIISVAKKAQAHEFISALSEEYDTLVGERGIKLSGGQKQRVAIARAMLKNAPILILDEATSALDSESEVEIQKALHVLMDGKTVIAVAHRLSTLREMDRILVLENGKIVEDGSHDALVQNGGTYARLWKHQAGGFLQE